MAQTVRDFLKSSYKLVSAGSPTVSLYGDDQTEGLNILNRLLSSYSGTSLRLTIAKEITFTPSIAQETVTFASPSYTPAADVQEGRLSNFQNGWLTLEGVTYPLIEVQRSTFLSSYKYDPQQGLVRFCIIYNGVDITTMRIYPSPSQLYTLHVYGKFQLEPLDINGDMSSVPEYYYRYLQFATAKDLAFYKGRSEAWTEKLEKELILAEEDMVSVSAINVAVTNQSDSYLNGHWRIKAGI
jgi:hypothetical protein